MDLTQIVGYLGSLVLVVSFMLKNITHIRIVNLIGCILFVVYGVMLGILWPIIIPNAAIALVQIYYLFFSKKS